MADDFETIRIDELQPTSTPTLEHVIPAMKDGITIKISIDQIVDLLSVGAGVLLTTGGTMTGDLRLDYNNAKLIIDKLNGQAAGIVWQTDAKTRWVLASASDGETTGDAGSSFKLTAYSDDGATLKDVISVNRKTGIAQFLKGITNDGNLLFSAAAAGLGFTIPDVLFGARNSPPRFVWNSKVDGSGTDVASMTDAGALTLATLAASGAVTAASMAASGNITSGTLGLIFGNNNCPNGISGSKFYTKFANNILLQYGYEAGGSGIDQYVTFPLSFGNVIVVFTQLIGTVAAIGGNTIAAGCTDEVENSRFAMRSRWLGAALPPTHCPLPFHWLAIGYA